jgi:hypothetical protein
MEEPSREPSANGSSEPPRPSDDANARTGAIEDRDWSAGRLSVVEADTAAAAFRPSWETDDWASPEAPTTQLAEDVAATPAPVKSFGEAPVPMIAEPAKAEPAKTEPAKAEPAKAEPKSKGKNGHAKSTKATKNGAKAGPKAEPPKPEPAKADPAKAEPPKTEPPKAASAAAVTPAPAKAAVTPAAEKAPVARASDRPLSTAEVRAISSEITDGYPAIVPSSRPTKAILVGVAVLVALVVGTVWSMTGSPEAPTTNASPTNASPTTSPPEPTPPSPTPPTPTAPEPAEVTTVTPETAPPVVEEPVVAPEPPPAPVEVRVTVRTVPANATLTLDGAAVTSPIVRPQDLLATSHTLEARADGYEPRTETVRFDRDGTVRVELRRVPPPVVTMAPEPPRVATTMATTMATTTAMAPSMAPVRISTMAPATPMRATMASGAGFTTDNPY